MEKDFKALDSNLKKIIVERLLSLKFNPRPPGSKKLIGAGGAWRIRLRDWRVIYEIDDVKKEVLIYRIKHRSGAY